MSRLPTRTSVLGFSRSLTRAFMPRRAKCRMCAWTLSARSCSRYPSRFTPTRRSLSLDTRWCQCRTRVCSIRCRCTTRFWRWLDEPRAGEDYALVRAAEVDARGHRVARPCRGGVEGCLLYTSDAADDLLCVDLGGR